MDAQGGQQGLVLATVGLQGGYRDGKSTGKQGGGNRGRWPGVGRLQPHQRAYHREGHVAWHGGNEPAGWQGTACSQAFETGMPVATALSRALPPACGPYEWLPYCRDWVRQMGGGHGDGRLRC